MFSTCLLRKEGSDLTMLPVHALLDWEYTGVLYLFRCSSLRENLSKAHSYLLMHAKQLTYYFSWLLHVEPP